MKRPIIAILVIAVAVLYACNNLQQERKKQVSQTPATDSVINQGHGAADSAFSEGARLIARNDCLTCHNIDKKVVGPSYKDVARKYRNNYEGTVDNLASSIIHGSRGIWGQAAMTPHPNLSHEDARKMILYIFSLRDSLPVQDTAAPY